MRIAVALMGVVLLASLAGAQDFEPISQPFEDISNKCYLTAVYDDYTTTLEQQLKKALYSPGHPLYSLREGCIFNEWSSGDAILQRTDWQDYLGASRPVLLLQAKGQEDGSAHVIFVASGNQLHNLKLVVANIGNALLRYKRWLTVPSGQRIQWKCDPRGCFPRRQQQQLEIDVQPQQQQATPPKRKVDPITSVDVDLPSLGVDVDTGEGEEPAGEDERGFPLALLLIPLLGAGAGIASHIKNQS